MAKLPRIGTIPFDASEYVRQPDIYDVVPSEDKKALYDKWCETPNILIGEEQAFFKGYDLGEAHGYTLGFNKGAGQAVAGLVGAGQAVAGLVGAGQAVAGLVGVADRGARARKLASGNSLNEPSNKLEAINADQLTAEICNILAQYSVMPVDLRVKATIDALNSLPGVEIKT